jgi:hypothetical protein
VWLDVRTVPASTTRHWPRSATGPAGRQADRRRRRATIIDDRPAVEIPADDPLVLALCAAHEAVTASWPPR